MSFILSKVLWTLLSPGNILVLALLLAAFLATAQHKDWQNFGQKLGFNIALLLFFVAIFPVGDWALSPLENQFPTVLPQHVDGIILLGGTESPTLSAARNQPIVNDSAPRYLRFLELARTYPEAKLLFSGGSGHLLQITSLKEADIAKQTLKNDGLSVDHLILEDKSRNTYENAEKSKDLVHPAAHENWLLVTSAWHMPRAIASFRKAGWNVFPQPVGYLTTGQIYSSPRFDLITHLLELNIAVHEYVGLVAYRLIDKTDQLWPH